MLQTARLELIATTLQLARAEQKGVKSLAEALNTTIPASWPPPLNDEGSQRWVYNQLERDPNLAGWTMWYFVLRTGSARQLIGNGGFKGAHKNGSVEIGYSILAEHQSNGYATEAARVLIAWAFAHPEIDRVAAETLPELKASLKVMRNCGMTYVGKGEPEQGMETAHYELTREGWKGSH